jgi:hypothetical protein
MKQPTTLFLKLVVALIGIGVLAICVFALPIAIRSELSGDFDYAPILIGLYLPAIPFFIALYQAFNLLSYIDKNIAFSDSSVIALKNIKYCAVAIGLLFSVAMPYIFILGDRDDSPGFILLGLVIIFASFVIATFAAVLQMLIKNGIDIKSENELTV